MGVYRRWSFQFSCAWWAVVYSALYSKKITIRYYKQPQFDSNKFKFRVRSSDRFVRCWMFQFSVKKTFSKAVACLLLLLFFFQIAMLGQWGPWGDCSVSCGDGIRLRRRDCLNVDAAGIGCEGRRTDTIPCSVSFWSQSI